MIRQKESETAVRAVDAALARLPRGRWLLAVSGGRDSMVLLDAMVRLRASELAGVATMDHGTGTDASRACALVVRESARRGLAVMTGRAPAGLARTEAHWRAVRRAFLDGWARECSAELVTAHTRDDQIETVVQRLLRGSGPRGLAAMLAGGARPLLTVPRSTVAAYASARNVPFVEDPSNASLEFQRNRVRHEILPALERAVPGFADWCWRLSERSAAWRQAMDECVDALEPSSADRSTLVLAAPPLAGMTTVAWGALWPALAARVGVVMDRRGIDRAASWAPAAAAGSGIPLAGGARIERTALTFVLRGTTEGVPDYILSV